ncbi:hypothetical protein EAE91_07780 [Photorhabdus noenieputensis]|nr:hypothetical protein [Photorhabdus noenieputensis]
MHAKVQGQDDHLHQFRIYGKNYGISYSGGIGFPDNPYKIMLNDFEFDAGDRFTYEYNFFEHWIHDIRIETVLENSNLTSPFCLAGNRMPDATLGDEADKTLALLDVITSSGNFARTAGRCWYTYNRRCALRSAAHN